jgi:hypothetical protein
MCCPRSPLLAEGDTEFDLRVRGLLLRLAGEGKTGICPRTPSIVSRTCKPKPAGRAPGNSIREPVHTRTVSPSVHPRPASGGATNFFLASALVHHPALRPNSGEDTRCDRPMSATHTNYVHPHLARFQLALAAFAARTPHGVLGSVALTGGPSVSRHPRPLRRIVMRALISNLLPHGLLVTSVGVFGPRRCCDRASDTPVATSALPPPRPPS